jgi:hypothetical protein
LLVFIVLSVGRPLRRLKKAIRAYEDPAAHN